VNEVNPSHGDELGVNQESPFIDNYGSDKPINSEGEEEKPPHTVPSESNAEEVITLTKKDRIINQTFAGDSESNQPDIEEAGSNVVALSLFMEAQSIREELQLYKLGDNSRQVEDLKCLMEFFLIITGVCWKE
jgi:hypothetical protein